MSEYINKADILSFIRKMECSRYLKNDSVITDVVLSTTECIKKFVSTMQPADVQPVVHCKDCRWRMVSMDCTPFCSNDKPPVYAITDYFGCIYGKRKGADE